jgi:Rap1 Myb domain
LIYDPDDDDAIETILDEKTGEFVKLPSSSRQTTTLDVVAVSMRLVERAHREKSKENERSRGGNEKSVDKKKTKKKKKAVKTREEDDDMETTAPARLIRQSNRLNRDRVASEETDEEEEVVVVSSSPKKKLAPSKKPKKVAKNQEEATKPTRVVRPSNRLWDRVGSRDTDEEEEEEVVVVSSPSKIQLAPSKKTKKIVKNHDEEVETTKSTRVFRKSKQRFRDRVGWEGTDNEEEDEPIVSSPPRMPLAPPTKPKKIVKDPDIFLCKYITWAEVFRRENEIRAKNGDPPLKAKQKKKKKPPVLRNPLIKRGTRYTEEEDLIILEYVKEHDGFRKIKGRAFWAKASIDEASGCVRTWQSLKERVYKMIVPRIHQ